MDGGENAGQTESGVQKGESKPCLCLRERDSAAQSVFILFLGFCLIRI